ncbi:MAG: ScpA family protein [Phycisphaerae bacterium]
MNDYRVNLDVYNGPLDLLLYLIRRDELDIYDIPIARVTEQYVRYVDLLQQVDPNLAGEFLVMAAALLEIKTRMLLPAAPEDQAAEQGVGIDPRAELVRQLLQYKAFKDAAGDLAAAAQLQAMKFPRRPVTPGQDQLEYDLEDAQVWDLLDAFSKLLAAIGQQKRAHDVIYDDTPVELHAADIMDRLSREGAMTFARVFEGRTLRSEIIGLFIALLELVRQKKVLVVQDANFGQISIAANPDAPADGTSDYVAAFADKAGGDDSAQPATVGAGVGPGQAGAGQAPREGQAFQTTEGGDLGSMPDEPPADAAMDDKDKADAGQYVSDTPETRDEPGESAEFHDEGQGDGDTGENQGIGS